ncbi:MAG TPA: FliM/FliN family flagellar motor C-terminal domain-containing protein [Sphingomonas sp.]|jgi:flagellar motor switch/type III secretory pathway protein FliN|nr:FliM/FliN family flagellar motor C-terminal domain-containing protein [Sphingomonas sp.]
MAPISPRSWLPAGTPPPPALDRLIADSVAAWSRHWLAGEPLPAAAIAPIVPPAFAWREAGDGLLLGTLAMTPAVIGARMLDVTAQARSGADLALLEGLAERCLIDLRLRFAAAAGLGQDVAWHPATPDAAYTAIVGDPHQPTLAIGLTPALFARMVRQLLPRCDAPPLGSARDALAATPIKVGAAIGACRLTVADLAALEVGDVLRLDRTVSAPVPIVVDGTPLPRGRIAVIAAEPQPFLRLVEPLTQ